MCFFWNVRRSAYYHFWCHHLLISSYLFAIEARFRSLSKIGVFKSDCATNGTQISIHTVLSLKNPMKVFRSLVLFDAFLLGPFDKFPALKFQLWTPTNLPFTMVPKFGTYKHCSHGKYHLPHNCRFCSVNSVHLDLISVHLSSFKNPDIRTQI